MQPNYADDLAVDDGDQDVVTLSAFVEKVTNRFEAAVRQLQRVADRLWCGVTFPDSFGVRGLRFADGDVHIQPHFSAVGENAIRPGDLRLLLGSPPSRC